MSEGPPTISKETIVIRTESHLSTTLDDEAVLLEPEEGVYYGMNEIGTKLWEQLKTPIRVGELESVLLSEYNVDEEVVKKDIREFISNLNDAGLIEIQEK